MLEVTEFTTKTSAFLTQFTNAVGMLCVRKSTKTDAPSEETDASRAETDAADSTGTGQNAFSLLTLYIGGFLTRRRACVQASGVSAIHGAGEPPTERRGRRGKQPAKQCAKRSISR